VHDVDVPSAIDGLAVYTAVVLYAGATSMSASAPTTSRSQ
jgi:hypothetical protein